MRQHVDMRDRSESPEDTGRSILFCWKIKQLKRGRTCRLRAAAQQLPRKAALTVGAVPVRPSAAPPPALPPSPPSAGQRSQEAGGFAAGGTHRRSALCAGLWCRVCCGACRARRQALGPLGVRASAALQRPDRDGFPGCGTGRQGSVRPLCAAGEGIVALLIHAHSIHREKGLARH